MTAVITAAQEKLQGERRVEESVEVGSQVGDCDLGPVELAGGDFELVAGGDFELVAGGVFELVAGGGVFELVAGGVFELVAGSVFELVAGGDFELVAGSVLEFVRAAPVREKVSVGDKLPVHSSIRCEILVAHK